MLYSDSSSGPLSACSAITLPTHIGRVWRPGAMIRAPWPQVLWRLKQEEDTLEPTVGSLVRTRLKIKTALPCTPVVKHLPNVKEAWCSFHCYLGRREERQWGRKGSVERWRTFNNPKRLQQENQRAVTAVVRSMWVGDSRVKPAAIRDTGTVNLCDSACVVRCQVLYRTS